MTRTLLLTRAHIVVRVCQLQRGATAVSGMCDGTLWAVFRNSMLTTHTCARRHTQSYTLPRQTCGCAKNTILRSWYRSVLTNNVPRIDVMMLEIREGGRGGGRDARVLCPHHWHISCCTFKVKKYSSRGKVSLCHTESQKALGNENQGHKTGIFRIFLQPWIFIPHHIMITITCKRERTFQREQSCGKSRCLPETSPIQYWPCYGWMQEVQLEAYPKFLSTCRPEVRTTMMSPNWKRA